MTPQISKTPASTDTPQHGSALAFTQAGGSKFTSISTLLHKKRTKTISKKWGKRNTMCKCECECSISGMPQPQAEKRIEKQKR